MPRRLAQLIIGLALYGLGCALIVRARIGVEPWTVLAQGLALHTGIGVGWMTNIIGLFVLILWIPLRQRPGVGTILNILLIGTTMQLALTLLPDVEPLVLRIGVFALGLLMVATASGLYIGARLGPGPRDGLMTGIHERFGTPIWLARGGLEFTVLVAGWLLGGNVGVGTVAFAVLIGPLVHIALPLFDTARRSAPAEPAESAESAATARS